MQPSTAERWHAAYDAGVPHRCAAPPGPIPRLLDDTAARLPDRPCVTAPGVRWSYRELRDRSDRLAGGLRRAGVGPGDRVALLLPTSPEFVLAYFGALKAGAVVVPLDPAGAATEVPGHLARTGATVLVTRPELLAAVPDAGLRLAVVCGAVPDERAATSLDELLRAEPGTPAAAGPDQVGADEVALLMSSGGTTGTAKTIELSHAAVVANAWQVATWGHLRPEDRVLAVLPLFHGFGMGVTMNAPLLAGAEIVLLERFAPQLVLDAVEQHRPTFLLGVPLMFAALLADPSLPGRDLSSLEGVFVGAAPLPAALKERFEAVTGARMIEGYGLTEAVTAVLANPYRGVHKAGSVGVPFPGVGAAVVDPDDGHPLPPGIDGEIVLRSPTVMLGYAGDPAATERALRDGWLHTGDLGHVDDDGYFWITDRLKDLIITGGHNVVPREVDEVLTAHPAVLQAAAVGVPDPLRGERVKAFVVLRPGASASAEDLVEHARAHLLPYKVPAEIEFRDRLPSTSVGKVLRRALRDGS